MKYYKFEKIKKGDNPIVRVTYKNWWGNFIERDIYHSPYSDSWIYVDNGKIVNNYGPINVFMKHDDDIYYVNGVGTIQYM